MVNHSTLALQAIKEHVNHCWDKGHKLSDTIRPMTDLETVRKAGLTEYSDDAAFYFTCDLVALEAFKRHVEKYEIILQIKPHTLGFYYLVIGFDLPISEHDQLNCEIILIAF